MIPVAAPTPWRSAPTAWSARDQPADAGHHQQGTEDGADHGHAPRADAQLGEHRQVAGDPLQRLAIRQRPRGG